MTASSYAKMLKQLKAKPVKLQKYEKHNKPKPRKFGVSTKACRNCGRLGAHIQKYGLSLCRQCFRDLAQEIKFKKYH